MGLERRAFLGAVVGAVAACRSGSGSTRLPDHPLALTYRRWDGHPASVADHRGRWLLIHVLATWSGPALLEVPLLVRLHEAHAPCLQVLALVVDEAPPAAGIFRSTFQVPYAVGILENPARALGSEGPFGPVTQYPTSVLLDPAGRLAARQDGAWDFQQLRRLVDRVCSGQEVEGSRGAG